MYIPSYEFIVRTLGVPKEPLSMPLDGHISLNVETLQLLLRFIALAADYDEATYLHENPDVASAYEAGQITDLHQHFTQSGFFEGRKAASVNLDEDWYFKTYPDVAEAVKEGKISSALDHFLNRGEAEMRSPNKETLPWMQAWADALVRRGQRRA